MNNSEKKSPNEKVRKLLSAVVDTPESTVDLDGTDLDLALRVARRVRLLGRLARDLQKRSLIGALPDSAQDQLTGARNTADARRRLASWELDRIAWALEGSDDDYPVIALKGSAYILLDLPVAEGRIFADVDLLIPESKLADAEATLAAKRWRSRELAPYDDRYYRKWTHELPPLIHDEREVEVDLHHNILQRTARLKPSSGLLVDGSRPIPGSRYSVMRDEDIVLHAMTHLMYSDDLADKLRELVDIRDLLNCFSASNPQFWERLSDRASKLDLGRPVFYCIRYIEAFLDFEVTEAARLRFDAWKPNFITRWIMDRLVPQALFPPHPDHSSRYQGLCRKLLYIRSHWVRMPPWLLAYHLAYKYAARWR